MSLSKLNDDSSIPKWQLALSFGGIAVCVAGAYYFYMKQPQTKKPSVKQEDKSESIAEFIEKEKDPPKQAQEYKAEGNRLYKSHKFEEAIDYYKMAIDICPENKKSDLATYYQNRAAAYEQLKDWENVLKDCSSALQYNDKYLKALTRRAKACEILNDLEQALEDLTAACIIESFCNQTTMMNIDRVLKNIGKQHAKEAMANKKPIYPSKKMVTAYFDSFSDDPIFGIENGFANEEGKAESIQSPYERAKQQLLDGEIDEVLKYCNEEIAANDAIMKPYCLLLRATLKILLGVNAEALQDLNELLESHTPEHIRLNALIKRGTLNVTNDEPEKALSDLNEAVEADPKSADALHHRGQVHLLLGKVDEAVKDFNSAVSLNSNFPIAVVQRCYTVYRNAQQNDNISEIKECKNQFEEAIKRFPNCIEAYILFAQVLTESNDFDRANEIYIKAKKIEPDNPNIVVHQAMLLLQKNGNLQESVKMLKNAIAMDESNQLAYENLATIHVQSGNLKEGVETFDKAIHYARTELEMSHLFALRDAAVAQLKIVDRMGIVIPNMGI